MCSKRHSSEHVKGFKLVPIVRAKLCFHFETEASARVPGLLPEGTAAPVKLTFDETTLVIQEIGSFAILNGADMVVNVSMDLPNPSKVDIEIGIASPGFNWPAKILELVEFMETLLARQQRPARRVHRIRAEMATGFGCQPIPISEVCEALFRPAQEKNYGD